MFLSENYKYSSEFSVNATNARSIKRWVAPTIKELRNRKIKYAEHLPQVTKRSNFIDWNFNAEIYAYGKRLNENFDLALLERAFVQRSYVIQEELRLDKLGIEKTDLQLQDNRELAENGLKLARTYVNTYLRYHLPNYPDEGIDAVQNHLLSIEKLAHISLNLGAKEIILAEEYPPSEESLAKTFLAIIGALEQSQTDGNLERPYNFVRDFVCTQLNQLDINEVWTIDQPFEYLKRVCENKNIHVEARIIGDLCKQDILACCRIGIYNSETKKLLGTGFGESYQNGVDTASIDSLSKIFGTFNLRPFDFTVTPQQLFGQMKQAKKIAG